MNEYLFLILLLGSGAAFLFLFWWWKKPRPDAETLAMIDFILWQIKTGQLKIEPNSVTSTKIADDTISDAKIDWKEFQKLVIDNSITDEKIIRTKWPNKDTQTPSE
jgi:hypothetical protein